MLRLSLLCLVACAAPPAADVVVAAARSVPNLSDAQIAYHAYQVVLDRAPDPGGMDAAIASLQATGDIGALFRGLIASPEFAARPDLHDPAGYLERVYRVLLERDADPGAAAWGAAADGSNWSDIFIGVALSPEYASVRRPIAGVHFPIPIYPTVAISDADFVHHLYATMLAREPDDGGWRTHVRYVRAYGRETDFAAFAGSAELLGNPALRDPRAFVGRLYTVLLGRVPASGEVDYWASQLRDPPDDGWLAIYSQFVASDEYRARTCQTSYYTYDEPIARSSPLLDDLVTGRARVQDLAESTRIAADQDGSRLAFFRDPATGRRYAFSRYGTPENIRIYEQTAPATLQQVTGDLFDPADYSEFAMWMFEPQLAIDNSVCPRRYVLTLECDGQVCMSYSTTPLSPASWSPPVRAVANTAFPFRSASTGRTVFDHKLAYLSWSEVYAGAHPETDPDDGDEHVSSSAIAIDTPYDRATASVASFGQPTVLPAEANVYCTDSWDCNNKDGHDWRKEGAYFYLLYAGANYYGCDRAFQNRWGIAIARAQSATAPYDERTGPLVLGDDDNTCDVGYPMVHAEDGRLVITHSSHDAGVPYARWAELVWR